MSTAPAPVEVPREQAAWKPIGHLVTCHDERLARCGAPLLGIVAFGEFEKCPECDDEPAAWFACMAQGCQCPCCPGDAA